MSGYLSIEQLLSLITQPKRDICLRILEDHRLAMEQAPGSQHNHQAWPGGYIDHVVEVMNIAYQLYWTLSHCRELPFSFSDALVALFLHDLEKAFPAEIDQRVKDGHYERKYAKWQIRWEKIQQYTGKELLGLDVINAIDYAEGENDEYTNQSRKMGQLATFVHICDVVSARLWFDRPKEISEDWGERFRLGIGLCHACYAGISPGEETQHEKDRVFHKACWEKTYPLQETTAPGS
jgi:hypothetical protein